MNSSLTSEGFLIDKKIPFNEKTDISSAYVNVPCIRQFDSDSLNSMVSSINRYGFAIIDCGENVVNREDFLYLKYLFGEAKAHPRADKDGVVPINSFNPIPGHLDSTNAEHLLHTDGSFSENPGNILALQCCSASRIGGISIIASGLSAYLWLKEMHPHDYSLVHLPDAVKIKRNEQEVSAPLFDLENGQIRIRFRFPDGAASVMPKSEVAPLYKSLCDFFSDRNNIISFQLHPNQTLIADNAAIVHGRSNYPNTQRRDLRRLNLTGEGFLKNRLKYGFKYDLK